MYLVKTPVIISKLSNPSLVWNLPNKEKKIYISFDDGPTTELCMEILVHLSEYNAKATFFCVGENVKNNPQLLQRILDDGHQIGNHSYNHLNGWKTTAADYFKNISQANEYIDSHLFRPPYGRITYPQIKGLKLDYKIIMWSILSGDFDTKISPEQCLFNVSQAKEGDIIVFHDNLKSKDKIRYVLPRFLEFFSRQGFQFCTID